MPDHTYNFTVTATDNGRPALSGSANVRVSVANVNDEDPQFAQSSVEHVQLSEDAPLNTVIHVLQAYDPDGDAVTYSFAGRYTRETQRAFRQGIGSRVVSVLDSGVEAPGFKSQPRRCRVTVLGKLFTPIVPLFTKQQNW